MAFHLKLIRDLCVSLSGSIQSQQDTHTHTHCQRVYSHEHSPTIITSCGENAARLFLEVLLLEKLLVARKESSTHSLRKFRQSVVSFCFFQRNWVQNKTCTSTGWSDMHEEDKWWGKVLFLALTICYFWQDKSSPLPWEEFSAHPVWKQCRSSFLL